MYDDKVPPTESNGKQNRLRRAEAKMLRMTGKWHDKLCTTSALNEADLDYMEARAQI